MGIFDNINERVADSPVGRWFKLEGSGASTERKDSLFTTELRAGLATFVTMAYIVSVNASIISASGGTCECNNATSLCVGDPDYEDCVLIIKRDLITATAGIACIASFLVGVFANLPLGLAPSMGLNAYFTYTLVGFHGSGLIPYRTATAAIFVEGCIFFIISVLGIRRFLVTLIPMSIKVAMGVGIGLFLCFIGLQGNNGIGLVTGDPTTLVHIGGCPPWAVGTDGDCTGHHLESPTTWIGVLGFVAIAIMMVYRVKGAILFGILIISFISWPRGTAITYFPYTPAGESAFEYFKLGVTFHPIQKTLGALHFDLGSGVFWQALISVLYVDIMETTGTLFSMAKLAGYMKPDGDFERSDIAYMCDSFCVALGAVFGTSPIAAYVESGSGIAEGGKTGLTAVVVSMFMFISLFLSPIFASFPPWATGPALILVGAMILPSVTQINLKYPGDYIPAFITLTVMPYTFNIAYGIIGGLGSYLLINGFIALVERLSGGRIKPDMSQREPYNPSGNLLSPWVGRLFNKIRGKESGPSTPEESKEIAAYNPEDETVLEIDSKRQ